VLAEHPTWHVALAVFAAAGARVVALPVDDEGLQTAALMDAILRHNPAFVYLQPAFQNPTGVSLSQERRAALVAVARKYQLPIVEDDFAGEVGFAGPAPPLRDADSADTVIYLKSFAKLIAPALRIGVLVAPARYAAVFRRIQHGLDPFVPAIVQRALAHCLTSPRFDEHLRALRTSLAERWAALDGALRQEMPAGARWTSPTGGFCAWLTLPPRVFPEDFIRDAAKRGVDLAPGRLFCLDDSGDRGVRLAFAAVTPAEIRYGVDVMARLLDSSGRGRRVEQRLPRPVAP
jgi:2-aminoadipate transaminase